MTWTVECRVLCESARVRSKTGAWGDRYRTQSDLGKWSSTGTRPG